MNAQYGCHLNHTVYTEGATWGVVNAFWLPNGRVSKASYPSRAPGAPEIGASRATLLQMDKGEVEACNAARSPAT